VVETDPAVAATSSAPVRNLDDVLADVAVDVVAVCLPPGERAGVVRAAITARKHLILEKPPALDVAELDTTLKACERAGLLAAVMCQHRFALPAATWGAESAQRFGGATASIVVSRPRPDAHYSSGWRGLRDSAGGGVTAHLGVHYLDLACQLLGAPVRVQRLTRTEAAPGIDVRLDGLVEFAGGGTLTVAITSRSSARMEHLTVLGSDSWIEVRDGATNGALGQRPLGGPARPAAELRTQVYREIASAVTRHAQLDRASLLRARPVTLCLQGFLGDLAPAREEARV
jgi:predicted dehydrogenase